MWADTKKMSDLSSDNWLSRAFLRDERNLVRNYRELSAKTFSYLRESSMKVDAESLLLPTKMFVPHANDLACTVNHSIAVENNEIRG